MSQARLSDGSAGDVDYGRIDIQLADGTSRSEEVGDEMPLLAELAAFVDHLAGGPPPRSSAA